MKFHNMLPFRTLGVGMALIGMQIRAVDAQTQTLCSSQNTGSDGMTNIYQSNGACALQCTGQYAFAVVQWQQCWCTNIAPADTTDVSDCSEDCPGYPAEKCGNRDSGLYGYIQLSNEPSGTAGASSASSTSASRQSSTTAPSSTEGPETSDVSITVTQSAEVSVSDVTTTPTTTSTRRSSTSTSTSRSTPSSTEGSATPVTSVVMTTISGAVVTQTVTSTPAVATNSHEDTMTIHRDDGLGAGAIAGIVIGIIAALVLLAIGALLLRRRKRKQDAEESGSGGGKNLGRNVSVLSKAGLLARTRTSMGERDHDDSSYVNPATGQNSVRQSMMFVPGAADGVSPVSPLGSSDGSNHSRRLSKPMVYDQRLNPSALFANAEANGSRVSMQDQQDYSRPLGVMNPDPRASFESRA